MEQILSSRTAFFAIVPAFIGGIVLIANGFNELALVCFAIGIALLALFLLFIRQRIDITDIKCSVIQDKTIGHFHPIGVSGFIKARHPIELLDCKLIVAKDKKEYGASMGISLQEIIDSVPRSFVFYIQLKEEDVGQLFDWGLVYIKVHGKLLHTPPFQIKTSTHKDTAGKLIPKTKQLKDEAETTKGKLYELLDKENLRHKHIV